MTKYRDDPPYDGSPACPACPVAVRNLHAVVHNFVNATVKHADFGRAARKLPDFLEAVDGMRDYVFADERLIALRDKAEEIANLVRGPTRPTWTVLLPELRELASLSAATQPLFDAHFADKAHSQGQL